MKKISLSNSTGEVDITIHVVPLGLEFQAFVYYTRKRACHIFINDVSFVEEQGDPLLYETYQSLCKNPNKSYILGLNMEGGLVSK